MNRVMVKMARLNRNKEGYADSTAGIAIQRVSKEERKKSMGKKRSCRRTINENIIHEKAVKMRKMTDVQLVNYVENRVEKARSEGFNKGKAQGLKPNIFNIEEIITEIKKVRGIGEAKLNSIRAILEKYLEVGAGV